MNKSHKIAYLINKYLGPDIKNISKKIYYRFGFLISILLNKKDQEEFSEIFKLKNLNLPNKNYASHFGYYDRTSISLTNRFLINTSYSEKDSNSSYIYIHNLKNLDNNKLFLKDPICYSRAHNIQQGNLISWFTYKNQDAFIYNDIANYELFSCMILLENNNLKKFKRFPLPVQVITPKLSKAISIDYFKLLNKRKEYSYVNKFNKNINFISNVLYEFSLVNGDINFSISRKDLPNVRDNKGFLVNVDEIENESWNLNHAMYSPSGKSFIFLLRIYDNKNRRISNLIYKDETGKLKLIFSGIISHFCFIEERKLFIWGDPRESNFKHPQFFIYSLEDFSIQSIDSLKQFNDGHPTFSKKLSSIIFDSYPSFGRYSYLYLFNLKTFKVSKLLSVRIPPKYSGFNRIDLHPRFSHNGEYLTFDTYDHHLKKPVQAILEFI
tara:strand:+ start:219 stop:1532 length:1314 start_codon:yes stop_codon:yes gene_type:complete